MKDKSKKNLVILGGIVISVVLVMLIARGFQTTPIEDVNIEEQVENVQDVWVGQPEETMVVPSIEVPVVEENTNGDDQGTEQTIQSDIAPKPTYTEEELTNPQQTPSGEKVDPPTDDNPNPPQTQGGVTSNTNTSVGGGLPGFDNVPNGGANQGEFLEGMYENGNKVGIMD